MQERALRNEDDVAWSGLAIAAAHGRRAPLLLRPETLGFLLGDVEERLAARSPGAFEAVERLLAAYRGAGCLTAGEKALSDVLYDAWETHGSAARALRLALLERLSCGDLEGLARARAVAGDAREPVALRWQALATAAQNCRKPRWSNFSLSEC